MASIEVDDETASLLTETTAQLSGMTERDLATMLLKPRLRELHRSGALVHDLRVVLENRRRQQAKLETDTADAVERLLTAR